MDIRVSEKSIAHLAFMLYSVFRRKTSGTLPLASTAIRSPSLHCSGAKPIYPISVLINNHSKVAIQYILLGSLIFWSIIRKLLVPEVIRQSSHFSNFERLGGLIRRRVVSLVRLSMPPHSEYAKAIDTKSSVK